MALLDMFNDTPEQCRKAPFTYIGSKHASLEHILPKLPMTSVYVEPFGGSGVVLINRPKSKLEVFNDRHSGIVDFYRALRYNYQELVDRITLTQNAREEFDHAKLDWVASDDPIERAALWYTMVQLSFLGKGKAYGRSTNSQACNKIAAALPRFFDIHNRFLNVQIENQDYSACLNDYDSTDTVFYLDPPYNVNSQDIYAHMIDHSAMIKRVFALKGFVALSGYENTLYDKQPWDDIHEWVVADRGNKNLQQVERLYIKHV